ncbi:MAG: hypothetical protein GY757_18890 [bacterium]|nr:hypothetical protein [bacterium]
MLKKSYKEEDEIPKGLEEHYIKKGEKWCLDFEGAGKLTEFRANNRKMKAEIDGLKKNAEKFVDIDPEKYAEYQQKIQDIEDKKLIEAGQLDEVVEKRTDRMRKDYDSRVAGFKDRTETAEKLVGGLKDQLSVLTIDNAITSTIGNIAQVKKGAMGLVTLQARAIWSVNDKGQPVATRDDGTALYGPNGDPITIKEWTEKLVKDAPYLFEPSQGSGSMGSGNTTSGREIDTKGMVFGN